MVTLAQVQASNRRLASALPEGLVAVFAGATAGIGETSLREFARYAAKPRIYFLGRSQAAGDRLSAELKVINPHGAYHFISADLSSLKKVDEICRDIKSKEKYINILCLCQGTLILKKETDEGLNYLMALTFFGRFRFIVNLLPLLRAAPHLRRVNMLMCGTKEGKCWPNDWQGKKGEVPMTAVQGHMGSMMTLGLDAVQQRAPEVSFLHVYPGFVDTDLIRPESGALMMVMKYVFKVRMIVGRVRVPIREVGERQTYVSTSAMYPPAQGEETHAGVAMEDGLGVAEGVVSRKSGGGVYSVDDHGESAPARVEDIVANYKKEGVGAKLWNDTEAEFMRITGSLSI